MHNLYKEKQSAKYYLNQLFPVILPCIPWIIFPFVDHCPTFKPRPKSPCKVNEYNRNASCHFVDFGKFELCQEPKGWYGDKGRHGKRVFKCIENKWRKRITKKACGDDPDQCEYGKEPFTLKGEQKNQTKFSSQNLGNFCSSSWLLKYVPRSLNLSKIWPRYDKN